MSLQSPLRNYFSSCESQLGALLTSEVAHPSMLLGVIWCRLLLGKEIDIGQLDVFTRDQFALQPKNSVRRLDYWNSIYAIGLLFDLPLVELAGKQSHRLSACLENASLFPGDRAALYHTMSAIESSLGDERAAMEWRRKRLCIFAGEPFATFSFASLYAGSTAAQQDSPETMFRELLRNSQFALAASVKYMIVPFVLYLRQLAKKIGAPLADLLTLNLAWLESKLAEESAATVEFQKPKLALTADETLKLQIELRVKGTGELMVELHDFADITSQMPMRIRDFVVKKRRAGLLPSVLVAPLNVVVRLDAGLSLAKEQEAYLFRRIEVAVEHLSALAPSIKVHPSLSVISARSSRNRNAKSGTA